MKIILHELFGRIGAMKNALILHGTDFEKTGKERQGNWFPWLANQLEQKRYSVWLPELPEAWHPSLTNYWDFVQQFNFNEETILVGHSSGATAAFGILHLLQPDQKIKLVISVAGFYKDEGWNCEGLFAENYDWEKIANQAQHIAIVSSDDDPYISLEQSEYLVKKTGGQHLKMSGQKHFSVSTFGEKYRQFPELLELIADATT